ncbi:L,D-transpeptidase family protein [Candidatus Nomurabacteria bacterium]|nr:L,D-transpeptidase family protein [Candidatus Nomurabacteria bacterium]
MSEKSGPTVQLFSYEDDKPREGRGMLIPRKGEKPPQMSFLPASAQSEPSRLLPKVVTTIVAAIAFMVLGTTGYGLVAQSNLAAAPTVTIVDPYTKSVTDLEYGPQVALASNSFFIDTRDAFIEEEMTFIEVDMTQEQVRYFRKGILLQSAEIFKVGDGDSWWNTPSGLYKVEKKEESVFSNIGQVNLPWQLTFQGNFMIHGWPSYPDGVLVDDDTTVGGIRLSDQSAEMLYKNAQIGTPVLVHAVEAEEVDDFVYAPQMPEVDIPHYFVADLDNNTILAASDLDAEAPIASLTKLMTAVVAAENIDLDSRVRVTSPTFVTSLIPRLAERSTVSMYSLMQLLLVESSNEAAETIAGELGRDKFIEAMNAKARQLGMMHTRFADPSGLSAENISSVGDLYRLTQYIAKERNFIFEITAKKKLPSAYVGGEFAGLVNFNEVKDMDSFIGGKVGETLAAGQTSISLHKIKFQGEERTLVVIILGSDGRTEDIEALLAQVRYRFDR